MSLAAQAFRFRVELISSGIVKKWIESLRYLSFSRVTFEYFLEGFKILTLKNFTSEVMRSLALYITYAVYEPENLSLGSSPWKGTASGTASPARRKTISSPSPSETTPTDFGDGFSATIGRIDVAVGMLETYNAILCQQNDRTNIDRFARAVTNKVSIRPQRRVSLTFLVVAIPPCRYFAISPRANDENTRPALGIKWSSIYEKVH